MGQGDEQSLTGLAPPLAQAWRPAPAIKLSAGLHVAGLAALALAPASWVWVLPFLASHHALFVAASFAPRSRLVGANESRLPDAAAARGEIALTFDDGPDPAVTPQVLDMLDAAEARASFFCVARNARAHPELIREIVARGHAVENHTDRHPNAFGFYSVGRCADEIAHAQASLTRVAGSAPRFFRAPFGVRSPFVDPAVQRLGLRYISWTRRGLDTIDGNAPRVLGRLTRGLAAGDILVLHDGVEGIERARPLVLDVLPGLLESIARAKLRSVTLREAFVA